VQNYILNSKSGEVLCFLEFSKLVHLEVDGSCMFCTDVLYQTQFDCVIDYIVILFVILVRWFFLFVASQCNYFLFDFPALHFFS
jgi:hypothetical protein